VGHPPSVGVRHAHRQDPPVAVDVLDVQARPPVGVPPWPRPRARTPESGAIGQDPLGAVGIDPGHDVERPRAKRAHDLVVAIDVPGDETLDQVGGGNGGGELDGVDAGVDPMGGLGVVRARRRIGDGDQPEVAALVRAAVRLERHELGTGSRHFVQPRHELVVAEESVELVRHRRGH